uniref:hypothetical protein n=1 Tax=Vibrio coralliilyticus TaxID=190893 RepID=UPI00056E346A
NEVPAQSARLMERFGDGLVRSTASYSSQYLGAKMLGEDASFSWTNFAASVVGNAASGEVKLSMGDNLPSDFVSGMVGASAVSVLRGESLRENAGRFALDAFGNALGNVLVKGMAAQPSMPSRRPTPIAQGQSGARAATEPTVIVTPLGESERPIEWEEETLYQRPADIKMGVNTQQEAQLQALFDAMNRRESIDTPMLNRVLTEHRTSTPSNLLGLSDDDMKARALAMVMDPAGSRVGDRLAYMSALPQGQKWESMQDGWMNHHMAHLKANSREAQMTQVRNSSAQWQIAQGVADAGAGLLLARRPVKLTASVIGTEVVYQGHQHREQLGQIAMESMDNGGLTLAIGATPSYALGSQQGAVAGGGWFSIDWRESIEVNGGGYWSAEYGAHLARPNMSVDIGVEGLVFTSPYYEGALSGTYQLGVGAYNQHSISYIRADNGNINGYQYTYDLKGYSVYDYRADTAGQIGIGKGGYFTFDESYNWLEGKFK